MLVYTQAIEGAAGKHLFEEVYAAYCGRLLTLAHRRLPERQDAEDAVHQAFLALAEHFDRLSRLPRQQLEAYLVVVAERKCIDLLRQQSRRADGCGDAAALRQPGGRRHGAPQPPLSGGVAAAVRLRLLRGGDGEADGGILRRRAEAAPTR